MMSVVAVGFDSIARIQREKQVSSDVMPFGKTPLIRRSLLDETLSRL